MATLSDYLDIYGAGKPLTTVKNNGITFNVVKVNPKVGYGSDNKITNDSGEPLIEIYDARFNYSEYGQFISRYLLSTFSNRNEGISLEGSVKEWTLSDDNIKEIKHWLHDLQKNHIESNHRGNVHSMVLGYIEAAFGTDTGDSEQPDSNSELTDEGLLTAVIVCSKFYHDNLDDCLAAADEFKYGFQSVGSHLWFTRNGHGIGFWDGDIERDLGDRLTEASKKFGETSLSSNDDGGVYFDDNYDKVNTYSI